LSALKSDLLSRNGLKVLANGSLRYHEPADVQRWASSLG
jgi:hypothetical protein